MKREIKLLFNILNIIFCISIGPSLLGQVDIEWSKSIDDFNDGEGFNVEQTTDGGYIVVGTGYLTNSHVIWLLKIDSDGNIGWSNTFGRGGHDGGRDVHQTFDGGFIIAGGDKDLWLIKTDANGDTLWTRTYEGGWPSTVEQTMDGGYIIINGTKLLRTDTNGDSLWTRTYEGRGSVLKQTSDGGFIIAGDINSGEDYTSDIWLVKTNPEGDTMWTRTFEESGEDGGNFVQQTNDGGYIVAAGRNWNHWDFSEGCLIKIDSIGNTQWIRTDSLYSSAIINQLEDGSYLVLGDSYESNRYNICLTKIDDYGQKIWTRVSEQERNGWYRGGQPTNDDGFIIVGGIDTEGVDDNLWLVKVRDNVTSTNEETEGVHLSVHPNPTSSFINIGIDHPGSYSIYIYSSNGWFIYSERLEEPTHQIDLSSFQKGVYFITIRSRDFVTTEKIIKL